MIPFMIWNRQQQDGQTAQTPGDDAKASAPPQPEFGGFARSFADAIPDPFMVVDNAGRVLAANENARQLFNAAIAGDHLSQHVRAPSILEAVEDVIGSGIARRVDYERRTGGGRRFEAFIAPLVLPSGGPALAAAQAASILFRDLTAQQHLERMRTDFVANASHELRTPLASLTGYIETLQGPARNDPAAQERFLGRMLEQAHRMRRLIDDLLSLSRVEMNVHRPPAGTVDLAEIARYTLDMLAGQARAAGCALRLQADGQALVTGDRDELIQVMQNLVENAIKYGAPDKGIDIAIRRDAVRGRISLSVTDHGEGIAAEHLPRLTERFYRVNEQESRSRGGTGLGLAIVKHIVLRHRGDLDIRSARGTGSTFTVRLPAAASARNAAE
jgi:two-component system phosphate regulon sensor histidine kinase PhoR